MVKKIAYLAVDNGVDGKGKDSILYATFDEEELKRLHRNDASANFRTLTEIIVDVDAAKRKALAKLNGVDRLVLGLPNWLNGKIY